MEIKQLHQQFLTSDGISTDTRNILPNTIFFALKGENFNANHFAKKALEAGASFAVIDEAAEVSDPRFILVPDVLKSLQELAAFHRRYCGIPVIGLTGSNGKTTTKELINACLSRKFRTVATRGNLNNHIGVPLTLLNLTADTEVAIVEMGANHPGEIGFLCTIAQPDIGYITNFGKAHLEGFKTLEGVIAAKSELYDYLKENQGTLFLNLDDVIQKDHSSYSNTFTFGSSPVADLQLEYPEANPFARISVTGEEVESRLIGSYNSRNMAAAFAIGRYFKVPDEDLKEALITYTPANNRSQILEKDGSKIILDAYNANPTSMAAAVDNLEALAAARKIAVLGDMFELGDHAAEEHQNLAERLEKSSIDSIFLIGVNFYSTHTGKRISKFQSFEDFRDSLDPAEFKDATILIKGSRGMALERVLDLL